MNGHCYGIRHAWLLLAALLLLSSVPALAAGAEPSVSASVPALTPSALIDELRHGGLILYFRHVATDFGQSDENMTGYEDCARQRNLIDRGRDDARRIGAAIKRLDLPIGDVLASPFCRTLETARLIFGRATPTPAVRGGPARPESAERYAELRSLLSTAPRTGTDLVIVSHGNPFHAVAAGAYLAEGEAAVIRPLGARGFEIIGRIPPTEWESLH
jgi:broad specificity phosphatase PhoE